MKRSINKTLIDLILIAIGCFIIAFGYNLFNAQSGIIIGGLSGLCIILADFLNSLLSINISFIYYYAILNLILLVIAYKSLGKRFMFYTLFGMISFSILMEVCVFAQSFAVPSNDLFLCSIFGGILIGVGVGITIRFGGSTGGSDIIACAINNRNNKIGIGTINFLVNALVVVLAIITDGFTLALYGLICIYLTGLVTDFVLSGTQSVSAYYIVSRKSKEISEELISKLNLRITAFHSTALTTNEEIDVLCCVLKTSEINSLKRIIYDIDKTAFVFATKINEAMNKGFSKLEDGTTLIQKLKRKKNSYFYATHNSNQLKEVKSKEKSLNDENVKENNRENK